MLTYKISRYTLFYSICSSFFIFFFLISCQKEKIMKVNIDVSYVTADSNFTVPAKVRFINNTSGAENYKWTFEGGDPSSSTKKDPGIVTFSTVGMHKVTLEATNQDNKQLKEWVIKVDSAVQIDFDTVVVGDNHFAPLKVYVNNKTKGASAYQWSFDGGMPNTSTLQQPDTIVFNTAGNHTITLRASNGSATFTLTKTVTILPSLQADFSIIPFFEDEDYEAPLSATLHNTTVSGTAYTWLVIPSGMISNMHATNPTVYFANPGTYDVTLEAKNVKETKTITKSIIVKPNNNLRTHKDIKLGIQMAHATVGSFYATKLRRVFKATDNIDTAGKYIDIVFFGLNKNFNNNKFISPDSALFYGFDAIPMVTKTKFINVQESCGCGVNFTATDFDNMTNDMPLRGLTINPTASGSKPFTNAVTPRIILFETDDGRKGAIKIKDFVIDVNNSYIIVDIKIQKSPL